MSDEEQQFEVPAGHKSGFVTIVGRPNVGKSTLLNAYMKQKIAIVTPRPQTTRIRQLGIITEEHYQMIFVDTPGLMKPRHRLDELMVDAAVETLADADVILWMVDGSQPVGAGDRIIAAQLRDLKAKAQIILGINKGDLLNPTEIIIQTEAYQALLPDVPWILFSAKAGNGRDELYQMIIDALPEGPRYFPPDQITDIFVRDIAAELIREQIMLQLREEIPYGVAVQVTEFKERENGVTYVNATIITEKENHKQIIIGAKGKQLRALGASAREEIEDLVRGKVFLDLWVKVDANWRRNDKALRRLGYNSLQK